jgi:formylglycine-generating enzyme required for sulfatase activity
MEYQGRSQRSRQNWLRFPVGGTSLSMAAGYVAWLAKTGKIPGARLCTEMEWERAARGADDRILPVGFELAVDDANIDVTYDKKPEATGPDEVGAHPGSRSPFGVDDLVGSIQEWNQPSLGEPGEVGRGGSFVFNVLTGRSDNRNVADATYREPDSGFRICASLPSR